MLDVPTIKIIIGGDLGTGKTCLANILLRLLFLKEFDANIEDTLCKQIVIEGKPYNLEILDTVDNDFRNGEEKIEILINYDILIYTYAINDAASFNNIYQRYGAMPIHKEEDNQKLVYVDGKLLRVPPIILVGTKIDLKTQRQVGSHSAEKMKKDLNFQECLECSSLTDVNIDELLRLTIQYATQYQQMKKDLTYLYTTDDDSVASKQLNITDPPSFQPSITPQHLQTNNSEKNKVSTLLPLMQRSDFNVNDKDTSKMLGSGEGEVELDVINVASKQQALVTSAPKYPKTSAQSCCTIV